MMPKNLLSSREHGVEFLKKRIGCIGSTVDDRFEICLGEQNFFFLKEPV